MHYILTSPFLGQVEFRLFIQPWNQNQGQNILVGTSSWASSGFSSLPRWTLSFWTGTKVVSEWVKYMLGSPVRHPVSPGQKYLKRETLLVSKNYEEFAGVYPSVTIWRRFDKPFNYQFEQVVDYINETFNVDLQSESGRLKWRKEMGWVILLLTRMHFQGWIDTIYSQDRASFMTTFFHRGTYDEVNPRDLLLDETKWTSHSPLPQESGLCHTYDPDKISDLNWYLGIKYVFDLIEITLNSKMLLQYRVQTGWFKGTRGTSYGEDFHLPPQKRKLSLHSVSHLCLIIHAWWQASFYTYRDQDRPNSIQLAVSEFEYEKQNFVRLRRYRHNQLDGETSGPCTDMNKYPDYNFKDCVEKAMIKL